MLKAAVSFLLIHSLIVITSTLPVSAQPQQRPEQEKVFAARENPNATDLRKTIERQDAKFKAESATFDPVKAEKEVRKQTAKTGWSKRQKLTLAIIIFAIAAVVFVAIKYGKGCIRSNPAGCTPGVDDYCTCEEYAQNL